MEITSMMDAVIVGVVTMIEVVTVLAIIIALKLAFLNL
jgi:hypothetical protein